MCFSLLIKFILFNVGFKHIKCFKVVYFSYKNHGTWPRCCRNVPGWSPKRCRNVAAMLPQCCLSGATVVPQCCRIVAATLPQHCRNVAARWPQIGRNVVVTCLQHCVAIVALLVGRCCGSPVCHS